MNQNSMCYWFPKIKDLGIPVPKTYIADDYLNAGLAAKEFGFPIFLRTDLCSGKQDWKDTCFVQSLEEFKDHYEKILEANVRWEMLGIKPSAIVVREYLQLEKAFDAYAGNMPVNKERRYFVRDGKVECHHPYWTEGNFNNHPSRMANDKDWVTKLAAINIETPEEVAHLTKQAELVGKTLGGYWSVDFAKGVNGTWYLIDMALGDNSYHIKH